MHGITAHRFCTPQQSGNRIVPSIVFECELQQHKNIGYYMAAGITTTTTTTTLQTETKNVFQKFCKMNYWHAMSGGWVSKCGRKKRGACVYIQLSTGWEF